MEYEEIFKKIFLGIKPDNKEFCPYRICPIGAHIDHQFGIVSGLALNEGIFLYYKVREEAVVELYSMNFNGKVIFDVKQGFDINHNWGDYAKAAMNALFDQGYKLKKGFFGLVTGTLPIGGLASSSAVILVYLVVLSRINGISLENKELIEMAYLAERKFLGIHIGKLDQNCEMYCKKNCLLYFDTLNNRLENIKKSEKMPSFRIGIFYSGKSRVLRDSVYNIRVSECKEAATVLKKYAGITWQGTTDNYLREVTKEIFEKYKSIMPDNLKKRAIHYFSEMKRLEEGINAWKLGDINRFGNLIFESGDSSINYYESGSLELCKLHSIAKNTPGIWGGRFSGAGFKGCYMAIVDSRYTNQIEGYITEKFLEAFPEYIGQFSVHFCDTADGMAYL